VDDGRPLARVVEEVEVVYEQDRAAVAGEVGQESLWARIQAEGGLERKPAARHRPLRREHDGAGIREHLLNQHAEQAGLADAGSAADLDVAAGIPRVPHCFELRRAGQGGTGHVAPERGSGKGSCLGQGLARCPISPEPSTRKLST
jgi:hypothetical protein